MGYGFLLNTSPKGNGCARCPFSIEVAKQRFAFGLSICFSGFSRSVDETSTAAPKAGW
jgi:hypothetical protein